MAIATYKDDISRDFSIFGNCVYLGNGQGCGTIWFKSVPIARKALLRDGIKTGADLCDCSRCACHYSISDPIQRIFRFHICIPLKKKYAQSFEKGGN